MEEFEARRPCRASTTLAILCRRYGARPSEFSGAVPALASSRDGIMMAAAIGAFLERDEHTRTMLTASFFLPDVASWHLSEVIQRGRKVLVVLRGKTAKTAYRRRLNSVSCEHPPTGWCRSPRCVAPTKSRSARPAVPGPARSIRLPRRSATPVRLCGSPDYGSFAGVFRIASMRPRSMAGGFSSFANRLRMAFVARAASGT
jgi:hypothetical protein